MSVSGDVKKMSPAMWQIRRNTCVNAKKRKKLKIFTIAFILRFMRARLMRFLATILGTALSVVTVVLPVVSMSWLRAWVSLAHLIFEVIATSRATPHKLGPLAKTTFSKSGLYSHLGEMYSIFIVTDRTFLTMTREYLSREIGWNRFRFTFDENILNYNYFQKQNHCELIREGINIFKNKKKYMEVYLEARRSLASFRDSL